MTTVRRAMVLAAGRGVRLKPLTDTTPKPLVEVAGRTLLDRALDRFTAMDLVVVNAHHLADQVAACLEERARPTTKLSHETELLDTGLGVKNALGDLGAAPFFISSADILITVGAEGDPLERLAAAWDDATMDALLLLQPRAEAGGFVAPGDFNLDAAGRPSRRGDAPAADYVYTSTQLVHPRLFADSPDEPFSFNLLWDKAIATGRLFAIVHDGGWFTVDTPENLAAAPDWLARHGG